MFFLLFSHSFLTTAQNREVYDYLVKAYQLSSKGDFKNAESYLLKFLESKESVPEKYLVSAYNSLGAVDYHLGKYDEALKYYHLAENLAIDKEQFYSSLAIIYVNTGSIYSIKGSFPEAIKYFEKSIRIYNGISNPDKNIYQYISTAYLNLGLAYYKTGDYKRALEYLRKSSGLKLKLNLSEIALASLNIAKVYVKLGDQSKSEFYFLKSIDEFEKEFGPDYYRITSVFADYGLFLSSVGREQEALGYFQKELTICLKTYGEKHPFVSLAYKHIGDHYMKMTDYHSALVNYQKALISGVYNFSNPDINANPSLDSVLLDVDLLRCLNKKSEALLLLALQQDSMDLSRQMSKLSMETTELILKLISKIRNSFISEESRMYLAENEKDTYFFAIRVAQHLYSLTNDPAYIQKMYEIVLLGKAAVLRKGISENELFFSAGIPDIYKQKLDSINIDIAAYESFMLEESRNIRPDSKKLDLWKDHLFELNRDKEKYEVLVNTKYPQYNDLLQKTEPATPGDIQKHLLKDETVIDYLLSGHYTDGKRKMYIFLITRDHLEFKETDLDSLFVKNAGIIRKFNLNAQSSTGSKDSFRDYTAALFYMYENLIKPVEGLLSGNRLIIIPDEEVDRLPFDAFLKSKPDPDQRDFEGLQYLIYNYAISFGYSSSLIFGKESKLKEGNEIYAFSPDYGNRRLSGKEPSSLQGTNAEIDAISKLFMVKKFTGIKATETNFREAVQHPAIFHLAMHSLSDSVNSRNSYLMFETGSDNLNDGKLYNYEISICRISSPMVVLSACNSGTGTLYHGEGLMSLARGFILAGASSVIKTAWEVNDETSAAIIKRFYFHLSKGLSKDEAMRRAKLEYIRTNPAIYSNPYYWAAYEVLGDNSRIIQKNLNPVLIIILLILIIATSLLLIYLKRRSNFFDRSQ
jgi:CHAT domain-containing protein/Tfp pilus assembly protein PilF